MRTLIAFLFIISGISIVSFPFIQKQYYAYEEQKLIKEFRDLDELFSQQQPLNYVEDEETLEDIDKQVIQENHLDGDVVGIIKIDKIDLTMPLLIGATLENLNIGGGIIDYTSPLDEVGNTAIAAHRSFTYGRQFNRLDEIELGDVIEIETFNGTSQYEVFDILLVLPDDVSVLNPIDDLTMITLITCEPMYNPTHRIIVQAKKI